MAAEGLGELGGLAIADRARHLVHGQGAISQQLRGLGHADLLQVGAEAGLTGLGEGSLELSPGGGDLKGHVIEGEVRLVVALEDLGCFLVQDQWVMFETIGTSDREVGWRFGKG